MSRSWEKIESLREALEGMGCTCLSESILHKLLSSNDWSVEAAVNASFDMTATVGGTPAPSPNVMGGRCDDTNNPWNQSGKRHRAEAPYPAENEREPLLNKATPPLPAAPFVNVPGHPSTRMVEGGHETVKTSPGAVLEATDGLTVAQTPSSGFHCIAS